MFEILMNKRIIEMNRKVVILGAVISALMTSFSCAQMPINVVDPDSYLGMPERQIVSRSKFGTSEVYLDLFESQEKHPRLQMLLFADIKDDLVYDGVEFQLIGDTVENARSRIILYRKAKGGRNNGTMEYLYDAGDSLPDKNELADTFPGIKFFNVSMRVKWDYQTRMKLSAEFNDPSGRNWTVNIFDNRESIPPSAVLAPIAERIMEPKAFPFIFMDDITLIPWDNLEYSIAADGIDLTVKSFPVLMNGQKCSFIRYTKKTIVFDLMASRHNSFMSVLSPDLYFTSDGFISRIVWKVNGEDMIMRCEPPLPDIEKIRSGELYMFKWIVGTHDKRAVLAGSAVISCKDQTLKFLMLPEEGWSPFPGRSWVKDFQFEAVAQISESGLNWQKKWKHVKP